MPSTWDQITGALAAEIVRMADGDTVILSDGDRFVQMRQGVDSLKVEAVSNRWLPPHMQLSADDEEKLLALGWQPPDQHLGFDNWRCSEHWPLRSKDAQRMAGRLVTTLRDVLGVEDPSTLHRRAFNAYG